MYDTKPAKNARFVAYLDLGGSLNTKKDSHALSRNQLAALSNGWYASGNSISKRPGNQAVVNGTGATGSGAAGVGAASARFNNLTQQLIQSNGNVYQASTADTTWTNIGSIASGGIINTTQLFDPLSGKDTLFICDGKEAPRQWYGPTYTIGALSGGSSALPQNHAGTAAITPQFCSTLFSSLFYAGEPTEPTAVYISDPFQPQSFTQNALLATPSTIGVGGTYIPYMVGRNDGINGGNITGLMPLYSSMMVYKQAAIYQLQNTTLFGDSVWSASIVSASVGCTSPRSLVAFDTFHVFLGIDGVYTVDPYNGTRRISDNVPTFFDGSSGSAAAILDRTSAIGVRCGQRYLIFFDDGMGTNAPLGHPTTGLWFDFAKLDEDGYPCAGQIAGMYVGGVIPLRGPNDDGTFVWCDATQDRVGNFGHGYGDFNTPITVTLAGKSDFFADVGDIDPALAPTLVKVVDNIRLFLSIPQLGAGETLTFNVFATYDQFTNLSSSNAVITLPQVAGTGAVVGTAVVGTSTIGASGAQSEYQVAKASQQSPAMGRVVQVGFSETSTLPWTCLGYNLQVAVHNLGGLNPNQ